MKKQITKIICAALLVLATVFSLASCATIDGMKEDINNFIENEVLTEDTLSLSLCASEAVVVPATDDAPGYVEKKIAATVLPENATNKALEWEIYWQENTQGEDALVTDYVTIETSGETNNVCTVRCYQAFGDSVIAIKAKTIKGECEAICEVTFVGEPSELAIDLSGCEEDGGKVTLLAGQNYNFSLTLDNFFNHVGDEYGTYTMTATANGAYVATFGGGETAQTATMTLRIPYGGTSGTALFTGEVNGTPREVNYVSYSLNGNMLLLTAKDAYNSDSYYTSCVDDIVPSVTFTITETVSGLSTSVTVIVEAAAEEINMDSALAF